MATSKPKKSPKKKTIAVLRHSDKRRNLPTAEFQEVMQEEEKTPIQVAYERRNRDLDPQLVWRGKDEQDWSDLVVHAPPLYIQEKVHPKVLIDDLQHESTQRAISQGTQTPDLFADFNGLPRDARATEFYRHDANWTNRLILGDSLQVMASLAEREPEVRGKVQCIYVDPPYGINFNSNFQWSTTSRDVKDNAASITREPEVVKAFRDTWRDGIHTYLTFLRDRLTVARDLLADSGSIFIQIGNENLHRVRALLDEIFGEENFKSVIHFISTSGLAQAEGLATLGDYVLWYSKDSAQIKYRQLYIDRPATPATLAAYSMIEFENGERRSLSKEERNNHVFPKNAKRYRYMDISKPGPGSRYEIRFRSQAFAPGKRWWGTTPDGIERLKKADRLGATGNTLWQIKYLQRFPIHPN